MQQRLRDAATTLGINAEVIATRRDVEALVFGPREASTVMRGWRRDAIGNSLLSMLP